MFSYGITKRKIDDRCVAKEVDRQIDDGSMFTT